MTKNFLLAAASVVALGFAGAANAADLTLTIGSETVTSADAYTLASEIEGDVTGDIIATIAYDDELPEADNIKLTFTLSGGATFSDGVTSGDLAGFDQVIISEGGAVDSSSVTFLVSGPVAPSDPDDGSSATLTAQISFAAGATPSLQVRTTTENNTPIEGGNEPSSPLTFIDYESFLVAEANEAATDTYFATIDSGFTDFSNGTDSDSAVLGTVTIDFAENVFIDLDATVADEDQFEEAVITINGSSTNIDYSVSGPGTPTVEGDEITIDAPGTYIVTANADGDAVNTSSYTATADISFGESYEDVSNRALGSLSSILREGTSVIVPWVASNTLAGANNTRNVVRVSNISDEPTGQVYLEVVTASAAQGVAPSFTPGLVATDLTIPAGQDIQITSAQMQQFLGGDFRRADIRVTVEAASDDLIFRSRIAQGNGTVEEITLEPEVGPDLN
jgi:hypothetical protein